MKKVFLFALAIFAFNIVSAQSFGIKAGFNSTSVVAKSSGVSASESISGLYVGLLTEFELSDNLNLQPELQYVYVSKDGDNSSFINVPVLFNYNVVDNFAIQVGPQLSYLLDDKVTDFTNLGVDLVAGVKYSFTDNIFADARYNLNLTNHYTGSGDFTAKYNAFQVGLGYKF